METVVAQAECDFNFFGCSGRDELGTRAFDGPNDSAHRDTGRVQWDQARHAVVILGAVNGEWIVACIRRRWGGRDDTTGSFR